jgi:thiamine-phosphate pyrophosphorylase
MTDLTRVPDPLAAARRLPRGAAVILRDRDAPARAAMAAALAKIARRRGLCLLVAGDGALAARVGAGGLHLPEAEVSLAPRWRRRRPDWLILAAAHSAAALRRAARARVDAVLLSPAFPTESHPGAPALGPHRFHALATRAGLPVYALGGIDARTVRRLPPGPVGIAAIGALA